jgi:lipoprotein-releasing system permease protein
MPFELLLALRFLRGSRVEKNISLMIYICFITIFCSTCILTLVAAIMNGFERETYKKLQNIHADIIIKSPGRALNFGKLSQVLRDDFNTQIAAFSPSALGQVIMRIKQAEQEIQYAVILKGIEPATESRVSALQSMIIASEKNEKNLSSLLNNTSILIGATRAETLHLKPGDAVELLFPAEPSEHTDKIALENRIVTIAGIFKTGIDEFDEHMVYCSLPFIQELLNSGISEVSLTLINKHNEQKVIDRLKKRLSLTVVSWKELYPALVSALALEKYVMMCILALLIIMACINCIALLLMFITHKQTDIAMLRSMGMARAQIKRVFIILGLLITLTSGIAGLGFALIIATFLSYYPIPLPAAYQAYTVNYIPIYMSIEHIVYIILLLICLSICVILIPTRRITRLSLKKALNHT